MEENNTSDFSLYILLSVSGLLVVIDGLQLIHMIYNWEYGFLIVKPIFESCIKFELISKTIFSIYSFIAAFSSFSLTLFLLCAQDFFLGKFLKTYLHINYIFFGPYMVLLSILGIYHWEEVVYVCEKSNLNFKEVSVSNSVTIIGCFLISALITVIVQFLESFNFLLDSILKRETGSLIIGRFFWQIASSRANQARIRANNGNNYSANNQNVILNINDNVIENREDNVQNNNDSLITIDRNNIRNLYENNLENERLILANSQDFFNNNQQNKNLFQSEVNLNFNSSDDYQRINYINEAENKIILEENNNNPIESNKNTELNN